MEYLAEDMEVVDMVCDCGDEYDFLSGNCCSVCGSRFCESCLDEHWTPCPNCQDVEI